MWKISLTSSSKSIVMCFFKENRKEIDGNVKTFWDTYLFKNSISKREIIFFCLRQFLKSQSKCPQYFLNLPSIVQITWYSVSGQIARNYQFRTMMVNKKLLFAFVFHSSTHSYIFASTLRAAACVLGAQQKAVCQLDTSEHVRFPFNTFATASSRRRNDSSSFRRE